MDWSYSVISFEELLKLIKGFVDMLILASGYQSSGLLAHWDALTIKKAFQWGLFFEHLFRHLSSSDDYEDAIKELDAALLEMTSNPLFPQGLAHLSSETLTKATEFVLAHLLHTLPLRDAHLRAFLTAAIDMDLDELRATESDCLHVYLNKLRLQSTSLTEIQDGNFKGSGTSSSDGVPFTKCTVQELLKKQFLVSCLSSVDTGLDVLSKTFRRSSITESEHATVSVWNSLLLQLGEHWNSCHDRNKEQLMEYVAWNRWKSRSLSYMLDKRTVRLVSGSSMIFSAPKIQWVHVFDQLNILAETNDDLHETIELFLLGCAASRWSCLLDHFMSVSYDPLTVLKQYHEVCNSLLARSQSLNSIEEALGSKESGILEYLTAFLGGQLHPLWKLSPVLAAIAIPSWSPLFKMYLTEIEVQLKGDSPNIRCCTCARDKKEHIDCELAERIWCLYISHIRGSHVMYGSISGCS